MSQYYPPNQDPYDHEEYYDPPPQKRYNRQQSQASPGLAGLLQGLGIGAGIISAPFLIGAVVIIGIIFFCAACCFCTLLFGVVTESTSSVSRATPRPTRARPTPVSFQEAAPATGGTGVVGEDIFIGEIRWKFLEAQDLGNTLQSDNEFTDPRTTGGKFIRVRFEIENRGGEAKIFSDINLIDAQGRSFEDLNDVFQFIDDQEWCLLEQLNPNVPKTCTKIFEVPLDATRLRAMIGDLELLGTAEAEVDLGLN